MVKTKQNIMTTHDKTPIKKKLATNSVKFYDKDIKDDKKMRKAILTALVGSFKNTCGERCCLKTIIVEYTYFPLPPKYLKTFSKKFDNKGKESKSVKEFNEAFPDGLVIKGEEVNAIYIEQS